MVLSFLETSFCVWIFASVCPYPGFVPFKIRRRKISGNLIRSITSDIGCIVMLSRFNLFIITAR